MSDVYYLRADRMDNKQDVDRLLEPFRYTGLKRGTDLIGVKIHPGEEGNDLYISAARIQMIVEALNLPPRRTFLTDTTVLYGGRRMSAPDYMLLAREHGFAPPATPPFIVADGLRGTFEVSRTMPSCCDTATTRLASMLLEADGIVVISHFKGHLLAGFGGAIKNLGMGFASRGGKLYQHSSVKPVIQTGKCNGCGICSQHCPVEAITVNDYAELNQNRCTGCGECLQRCPSRAISVNWNQDAGIFMKRITEYALSAVNSCNIMIYINFVVDVSPDCDCMAAAGSPIVPDIGILVSGDPVAIDQASLDLVNAAPVAGGSELEGFQEEISDKFLALRPDRDGTQQLSYGQSISLGSRTYTLRSI